MAAVFCPECIKTDVIIHLCKCLFLTACIISIQVQLNRPSPTWGPRMYLRTSLNSEFNEFRQMSGKADKLGDFWKNCEWIVEAEKLSPVVKLPLALSVTPLHCLSDLGKKIQPDSNGPKLSRVWDLWCKCCNSYALSRSHSLRCEA